MLGWQLFCRCATIVKTDYFCPRKPSKFVLRWHKNGHKFQNFGGISSTFHFRLFVECNLMQRITNLRHEDLNTQSHTNFDFFCSSEDKKTDRFQDRIGLLFLLFEKPIFFVVGMSLNINTFRSCCIVNTCSC